MKKICPMLAVIAQNNGLTETPQPTRVQITQITGVRAAIL